MRAAGQEIGARGMDTERGTFGRREPHPRSVPGRLLGLKCALEFGTRLSFQPPSAGQFRRQRRQIRFGPIAAQLDLQLEIADRLAAGRDPHRVQAQLRDATAALGYVGAAPALAQAEQWPQGGALGQIQSEGACVAFGPGSGVGIPGGQGDLPLIPAVDGAFDAAQAFERHQQSIAVLAQPAGVPRGQKASIDRVEVLIAHCGDTRRRQTVARQRAQTSQLSVHLPVGHDKLGFDFHAGLRFTRIEWQRLRQVEV